MVKINKLQNNQNLVDSFWSLWDRRNSEHWLGDSGKCSLNAAIKCGIIWKTWETWPRDDVFVRSGSCVRSSVKLGMQLASPHTPDSSSDPGGREKDDRFIYLSNAQRHDTQDVRKNDTHGALPQFLSPHLLSQNAIHSTSLQLGSYGGEEIECKRSTERQIELKT